MMYGEDMELRILHEDNSIIVVEKPQNVPTQEDESKDMDLLSMVKAHIKQKYNKPGEAFCGLVHRLDRPTGGVMVFARNSKSAARLTEEIKNGDFDKTYFAVVVGVPREKKGSLVHYLKKDDARNIVEIVPRLTEGAKRAELEYEVLETKEGYSLVKVHLLTGRSHQIRVQMASLKTPIYADVKYGDKNTKGLMNLYCVELRLYHPISKKKMIFRSYPPEQENMWKLFDMSKYLEI